MSNHSETGYRFDCTDCAESLAVTEAMRGALLSHGCVVCGVSTSERAFSQS